MGRTARAGREGYAVTFVTDNDRSLLKGIVSIIWRIAVSVPVFYFNGCPTSCISLHTFPYQKKSCQVIWILGHSYTDSVNKL